MEKKDYSGLKAVILFACVFVVTFTACSQLNRYFGLEDDNVIEESVEKVIQGYTGMDIDLTPATPEK